MKKTIKINFVDFWPGFNNTDNYFFNLLKQEFEVEISNKPDFLFYSVFGHSNMYFSNCTKIFFTGENRVPPQNCDWSFSFENTEGKNFRLPIFLLYDGYYDLLNKIVDESLLNRKFCNQVVSNGACLIRNQIFTTLSQYKHIDSGGRFWNNIGGPIDDKLKFISGYKFSLAYENESWDYADRNCSIVSEKVMEPMRSNSIPIYWGNPKIGLEFNSDSFINRYDFNSDKEMIDYIVELDNNDILYMEKISKPWLPDNKIPDAISLETIKKFLYNIFY
jgi:hypothetical protein